MFSMKQRRPSRRPSRGEFHTVEFINPSGATAYRVTGTKLDGARIRENYRTHGEALARLSELQIESANLEDAARPLVTRLQPAALAAAEECLAKLTGPDELLEATNWWLRAGRKQCCPDSPTITQAADSFLAWLKSTPTLRDRSKSNLRNRVAAFAKARPSVRVAGITPDMVESYLLSRGTSAVTVDNYRRALSRFFGWCSERPRRWLASNPCREITIERGPTPPPAILSVQETESLLRAAEAHKAGRLALYTALCLFSGLRPESEVRRLSWASINLEDGEIRIEATNKTERSRVVAIHPTLKAWLQAYRGSEIYPQNWRRDFAKVRSNAGIESWPQDVLRHTATSHYFRLTGSYGLTSEQFGNSEAIIKRHYQSRVTTEETSRFYNLLPQTHPTIIQMPRVA